jgi:hypothetical protein
MLGSEFGLVLEELKTHTDRYIHTYIQSLLYAQTKIDNSMTYGIGFSFLHL